MFTFVEEERFSDGIWLTHPFHCQRIISCLLYLLLCTIAVFFVVYAKWKKWLNDTLTKKISKTFFRNVTCRISQDFVTNTNAYKNVYQWMFRRLNTQTPLRLERRKSKLEVTFRSNILSKSKVKFTITIYSCIFHIVICFWRACLACSQGT